MCPTSKLTLLDQVSSDGVLKDGKVHHEHYFNLAFFAFNGDSADSLRGRHLSMQARH